MKQTQSEQLSKLSAEYKDSFVLATKSNEPVEVTINQIDTMKKYYNSLIMFHTTLSRNVKFKLDEEIARVRGWLLEKPYLKEKDHSNEQS